MPRRLKTKGKVHRHRDANQEKQLGWHRGSMSKSYKSIFPEIEIKKNKSVDSYESNQLKYKVAIQFILICTIFGMYFAFTILN